MAIDLGVLGAKVELSTSDFDKGVKKIKSGFDNIGQKAFSLNQILEVGQKAWRTFSSVATTALAEMERGAKRLDVESTFERLAKNIGKDSQQMVDDLKHATKGAVTEMQAMATASQAMLSGMNFTQVTTALEYLQKYAKATDKSFQQLVSTIMTGMARGSVLMLDDAGIIIDQQSLIAQKTQEWGRALTEVEKKQVLVSAAIDQMKRKLPALGGEIVTQYDQIQSWKAAWQDFQDTLGKWALRAYGFIRAGFDGLKLGWTEAKIMLVQIETGFKEHFGNIAVAVAQSMMNVVISIRDTLSHTLSSLWDVDNAFINPLKAGMKLAVEGLDATLSGLFNMSMGLIAGEGDMNAKLAKLYEERAAIIQGGKQWVDLALGNFADGGATPSFDLSGTTGDAGAGKITDTLKTLQAQIDQLNFENATIGMDEFDRAMAEANFATEQLKINFAEFADNQQVQALIEQFRQLAIENANLVQSFEQWSKIKSDMGQTFMSLKSNIHDFAMALTGPLANAFTEFAKTGTMSIKAMVQTMIEELQAVAAQKTARMLMEALFAETMVLVSMASQNYGAAAQYQTAAVSAWSGAALMGSFVAGSGLAGMAHDGITNIPNEGSWLLQKNERVVDADTNADLKEFLKGGGSRPNVNMSVTFNNSDENSVRKALPELERTVLEIVSGDIANNGNTIKSIRQYA